MFRFICLASFVILFLILSIPLLIVEWIIGKFNMELKSKSSLAIVNWAFRRCLDITGVSVTVIGEENIPKDTAVLYVGNHRSYFDVLLTYVRVPRPTGYIAKKEMLRYPLLVNWMKNLHCLFLDRKDIKQGLKTILEGIEKVNDTFLPFHEGSFKIAEKSGCPIIPMSIYNSAAIFEDHLPKIKKAHVILEYCPPVYMKDLTREERKFVGSHVLNVIKETYFKNKAEMEARKGATH